MLNSPIRTLTPPTFVVDPWFHIGSPSAAGVTRESPYGEVVSRMGAFNSVKAMAWCFDAPPARKQGNPARYTMPTVASKARLTKAGPNQAQP